MKYDSLLVRLSILLLAVGLAGCNTPTPAPETPGLAERAAAEATAILQRAQATAVVLKAQATANAMVQAANPSTPSPAAARLTPTAPATIPAPPTGAAVATAAAVPTERNTQIEIVGVGFAADGGLIIVQFTAPPEVARLWNQTNVYVLDEETKIKYDDVPVTPLIGPLFGRPKFDGQLGYVMFYNTNAGIRPGSIVTVVFGDYKQEHLVVQQ